jgi:hypothetical protein
MIRYRTSTEPPHVVVEGAGVIRGDEVRRELANFIADLRAQPDGFVLLAEYPDLILIEPDAVEPLFYYIAHVFDADLGMAVFVTGGEQKHPGLREFMQRLGVGGQLHVVDTRDEADALIREFVQRSGTL